MKKSCKKNRPKDITFEPSFLGFQCGEFVEGVDFSDEKKRGMIVELDTECKRQMHFYIKEKDGSLSWVKNPVRLKRKFRFD